MKISIALLILGLLFFTPSLHAQGADGKLFDPGIGMTAPAESAPQALARLSGIVGQWDVESETYRADAEPLKASGVAHITYMNRGHSIMERSRIASPAGEGRDGEGRNLSTIRFFAATAQGAWTVSSVDNWMEAVTVTSGGFSGESESDKLVLLDANRPGGGILLRAVRSTYDFSSEDSFTVTTELSTDLGETWTPQSKQTYSRRASADDFFPVRDDVGLASPDRAPEAGQFDFLLGEFQASHWLKMPPNVMQWPANASAVHVLDGNGVLEFNWHDVEPNRPDAATTIVRVYNRAMRRWESLFLSNRNNVPLHFGGVREGDRIVLHPFAAKTAGLPLSQWIFFDAREDAYRWKGIVSTDRGKTWPTTWAIEFVRKGSSADVQAPSEVGTRSADGTRLFGDLYRPAAPASTTVVLFHQARGDARGEYGEIARRLQKAGFEVFAWDARAGGDQFGAVNRTMARLEAPAPKGYCPAYPDLEAALTYSFEHGSGGPLYVVGSSYSAALSVRLAAEHAGKLAGVAAFSPSTGSRMEECAVEIHLPKVDIPLLAFRPISEMQDESYLAQQKLFKEHGVELFVGDEGVHGASQLNPERSKGDVELTWARFLRFLNGDAESP